MLGHEASLGIQLDGVDVRALVQASGVLPQQHFFFFMDLALCTGGSVVLKQERAKHKLFPESWKQSIA